MAKRLHIKAIDRRGLTESVTTFGFELEGGLDYEAGQYVTVKLADVDDPRGPQRPFTLSSSPTEGARVAITTRMSGSPFKNRLAEIAAQGALDDIEMRGPMGEFTLASDRTAVMLAGGIGITAFRSQLRCAADRGVDTQAVLVYSASSPGKIAFRRDLDAIADQWKNLKIVYTITRPEQVEGWDGETGHIDAAMIRKYTEALDTPIYYVCGPPDMTDEVSRLVTDELGVAQADVRAEQFTGY